jgi:hypothetical protein
MERKKLEPNELILELLLLPYSNKLMNMKRGYSVVFLFPGSPFLFPMTKK